MEMYLIKWIFIYFLSTRYYLWCFETKIGTFYVVKENVDIVESSSAIESTNVFTVTNCGILCSKEKQCRSFITCHKEEYIICRLLDYIHLDTDEMISTIDCSYYEYLSPIKDELVSFLRSLEISIPTHLLKKEFSYSLLKETQPTFNSLIDTIPKVTKSWFVSFDIKRIGTELNSQSKNIVQFWNGNTNGDGEQGNRQPGVWLGTYQNSFRLEITASISGKPFYQHSPVKEIRNESFTNIMIIQYQVKSGAYIFEIYFNKIKEFEIENTDPREFESMKVYLSNPWQDSANCTIRNLVYANLE